MFSSSIAMSSRRWSLSTPMITAPSFAMIVAVARPMPLPAAVISATLSLKRIVHPPSVESRRLRHDFNRLRLARADGEAGCSRVLPRAEPLPDPLRWTHQRFLVHPFIGYCRYRFFLAMGEVQLLDVFGGVPETAPDHHVLVEILISM